ncbi:MULTISPECIES: UDP-N-acetylglucosamine--N-acetylmuramyl-(pentapeptide) pyrophosphoryl-undecaprenol N-acetylglucosamine transferase [Kitasatospora]|uniref:Glycosyl transferase family 28 C-terminal domain-containing protein n=1 Tax=Kitasatospora cystarginea TaxID=58350 RepID=A0ABP5QXE7_9ACTN
MFAAADVVISRAGAGTLAELTAIGKPAVLIPLEPTAADEQRRNAEYLAEHGAAVAITRPNVTADRLEQGVRRLIEDHALRTEMAAKSRALGHPDAAQALADLVLAQAR